MKLQRQRRVTLRLIDAPDFIQRVGEPRFVSRLLAQRQTLPAVLQRLLILSAHAVDYPAAEQCGGDAPPVADAFRNLLREVKAGGGLGVVTEQRLPVAF